MLDSPGALMAPIGVATDAAGNVHVTDVSKHQLIKYDANGNNAVAFGSEGQGQGEFSSPRAVAVDSSGRIYVADELHRVQVLDAAGDYVATLGPLDNGMLQQVTGLAVASNGHIFACDGFLDLILEWDQNFAFVTSRSLGNSLYNAKGLAIDSEDWLYVADDLPQRVRVYDTTDNFALMVTIGGPGNGNGEFTNIGGIAVDANRNVFVTDSVLGRVQKFAFNGVGFGYVGKIGSPGNGAEAFNAPQGVAVGSGGKVYIADWFNLRIQQFSNDLVSQNRFGAPQAGEFISPSSVAQDSAGNYYVVDESNYCVHKLSSAGTPIKKWGHRGSEPGLFDGAYGVVVNAANQLCVTDAYNRRIQVFNTNGDHQLDLTANEMREPFALALDVSGNIYTTDTDSYRVEVFTGAGVHITGWGEGYGPGDKEFIYPSALAISTAGLIYVADGDNDKVKIFTPSGDLEDTLPIPGALGLAFDDAGNLFVSSWDGTITVLDANGNYVLIFTSEADQGKFFSPGVLMFDAAGDLIVLDNVAGRVLRFTQTAGRAARRNSSGNAKQANATQEQKNRKRKGGNNRGKRRKQRDNGPRGRGDDQGKARNKRTVNRRRKERGRRD
ncbi:MAG: hypothetical protein KC442_08190 [Thermomicrobiales bacterium]|nr:hypothetical protein [Thermomicrobiales bacterium]